MGRHLDLSTVSTLRLGGFTKEWAEINNLTDIENIVAKSQKLGYPLLIVGGGSNIIFNDGEHQLLIGLMRIKGINIKEEEGEAIITAAAGENWDELVAMAVKNNWAGLEALSAIPGTVGAAPIQNIGAYGAEASQVILQVEAYDTRQNKVVVLENADCHFNYRDSIFKQQPKRFIITQVRFKLKKLLGPALIPNYPGVKNYLNELGLTTPTLQDIREAITTIRWRKLPQPSELPNNGSFFKNPVITDEHSKQLLKTYPSMPHFPAGENLVKIPAGWLIEQANLKGYKEGQIGTYRENALVVVNYGKATFKDLAALVKTIQAKVLNQFKISLEPEVNIVA